MSTIKELVQLATLKELSEAMSIPAWRLARWRRQGLIPSIKMGRTHYFNVRSVQKTLRRRERLGSMRFIDTGFGRKEK